MRFLLALALLTTALGIRASEQDELFGPTRIVVIQDVHEAKYGFDHSLEYYKRFAPTHVILTGDMVHDRYPDSLVDRIKKVRETFGLSQEQVLFFPGNHEEYASKSSGRDLIEEASEMATLVSRDPYGHATVQIEGESYFLSHYPVAPVPTPDGSESKHDQETLRIMAQNIQPADNVKAAFFGHTHKMGIHLADNGVPMINVGALTTHKRPSDSPATVAMYLPQKDELIFFDPENDRDKAVSVEALRKAGPCGRILLRLTDDW